MSTAHHPSGAEQIAGALSMLGAEGIFACPSGHISHLLEALEVAGCAPVEAMSEAAAVHMADGYYRVTGRPGVAIIGPGTAVAAALPALATSFTAGSAVLVIAAGPTLAERERLSVDAMDQLGTVRPHTQLAWRVPMVDGVERVAPYVAAAMSATTAGRPGPSYVEVASEVLSARTPATPAELQLQRTLGAPPAPASGDPPAVARAVALLKVAKRPVAIVGSGAWHGRAFGPLARFVEGTRVPTFTINMGRGTIPDDHPACFGFLHRPGPSGVLDQADVVLLLGTRLSHFLDYGRPPLLSPGARVIQVDIAPEAVGRERPVEVGVIGDLGSVLERMTEQLTAKDKQGEGDEKGKSAPPVWEGWRYWIEGLEALADESRTTLRALTESDQVPLHPLRLMSEIEGTVGRRDVVVADGGDTVAFCSMVRGAYAPGSWVEGGLGACRGLGLPMAIGAAVGRPNQRVVLVTGDGSLKPHLMEAATARRYGLNLVIVVNNNGGRSMVRHGARLAAGERGGPALSRAEAVVFEDVARAMGLHAETATTPDELRPALERALAHGGPALVDVHTDPESAGPAAHALATLLRT